MNPRLVASDMDGTFLDKEGQFDQIRLRAVLSQFEKKKMRFVAASGRPLLKLESMFRDVADQVALVAENGAIVTYQGETLFEDYMTKAQYLELAQLIMENPYGIGKDLLLSGKSGAYILKEASPSYQEVMAIYYENIQLVSDFSEVEDTIFKITTLFSPDDMENGVAWLNEQAPYSSTVTTGFESVDIMLKGVDKASGLAHLCQQLGIKKDDILAFGDNLNDLTMLEFAGYAVVPLNARDEVKAVADEVIGPAHSGSVLAYMEKVARDDKD